MRSFLVRFICSFALFAVAEEAEAQSYTTRRRSDSLRVYKMGEITVAAERERAITTATVHEIPLHRLQRADVATSEQLALQLPGAQIRTNSRGEYLVFMRGSGERSVGVFLDGALVNIPWDYRVDLAMLPMNAIGEVTLTKGVPSILYGANVSGGAVNFVGQRQPTDGFATDLGITGGQNGYFNGYATHLGKVGAFNYVGSLGYFTRDDFALPNDAQTDYGQIGRETRTNTDETLMNGYLRGEYAFSEFTTAGLTLNYITGEKGIASEAHSPARFWRYPAYQNLMAIMNVKSELSPDRDWTLRGTLWFDQFGQTINQYLDSTYTGINAVQRDDDKTIGGRVVLRKSFGSVSTLDLSINGLTTTHDQTDSAFADGTLDKVTPATYRQNTYSAGLEYNTNLTNALKLTLGGTYDMMRTPKTGGRAAQSDLSDFSPMLGLGYRLDDKLTLRANAGRKTRFPTMRELYGEALNRFVLNPNLHAERTTVLEAGFTGQYDWGRFDVVAFDYLTDGTLERIDTLLEGETRARRKRVNLEGSTTPGLELTSFIREFAPLTAEASIAWMHPRATAPNLVDSTTFLSERVEMIASLILDYMYEDFQPTLELSYIKPGYSPVDNVFEELPSYTVINARLAYRFMVEGVSAQVFLRGNNLSDAVQMNQIGLPGPGREIQGGIKLLF